MRQLKLERIAATVARLRLKLENSPDSEKVPVWRRRIRELEQGYSDWNQDPNKSINGSGVEVRVPTGGKN